MRSFLGVLLVIIPLCPLFAREASQAEPSSEDIKINEKQKAVNKNTKVIRGMTPGEVIHAIGYPDSKVSSVRGNFKVETWRKGNLMIIFLDGGGDGNFRVARIHGAQEDLLPKETPQAELTKVDVSSRDVKNELSEEEVKTRIRRARADREAGEFSQLEIIPVLGPGEEELYKFRVELARRAGEKADQTKSLKDILSFEQKVNEALHQYRGMITIKIREKFNSDGTSAKYKSDGTDNFQEQINAEIKTTYEKEKVRLEKLIIEHPPPPVVVPPPVPSAKPKEL